MRVNETLRARREDLSWTPQDVAVRLGVAAETVLRWESGRSPHTLHMLECWAEVLGHHLTTELTP